MTEYDLVCVGKGPGGRAHVLRLRVYLVRNVLRKREFGGQDEEFGGFYRYSSMELL